MCACVWRKHYTLYPLCISLIGAHSSIYQKYVKEMQFLYLSFFVCAVLYTPSFPYILPEKWKIGAVIYQSMCKHKWEYSTEGKNSLCNSHELQSQHLV